MTDINHIEINKSKLENATRSVLKENNISHLDAIIFLIQNMALLMQILEKNVNHDIIKNIIFNLEKEDDEIFNLSMAVCLEILKRSRE